MTDAEFGSFFLADPEAFPAAVEGEPWGDEQRLLDLPGGPFLITGLSASQIDLMDREYSSVIATAPSSNEGLHETTVYIAKPSFFREFDLAGWTYTIDLESDPNRLRIAALKFAALVPWVGGATAGLWTSVEDALFHEVIENYLRVMVAHRLSLRDGVLLHSAGIVIDGSGFLFIGASGAGKSTLARKAFDAGAPVLSDDLNAVVDISIGPAVARLPFTGDLRNQAISDGTVPLRGIFVLRQGSSVACETLSRGQAAASFVATAPFVNCGADALDSLMHTAASLTARFPVGLLTSAHDSSFEEIKRAVQAFQE